MPFWPFKRRESEPDDQRATVTEDPKLLEQRIILVNGQIDDDNAKTVIAKMLYLNYLDQKTPIRFLVNSPGGNVTAGMAIIDTMDDIGPPVHTCCVGNASGMALVIVAHGSKGNRTAKADATFMFTPILSIELSEVVEVDLQKTKELLVDILVKDTRQTAKEVEADMKAWRSLNAIEAQNCGIIDAVE